MTPVCLHSRRLWLLAFVTIGALIVTIQSLLALRDLMALAEAFSSGITAGLQQAGGQPHEAARHNSITLVFGLITVPSTTHPYLWTVVSGILTGGILGALFWALLQVGAWSWHRLKRNHPRATT